MERPGRLFRTYIRFACLAVLAALFSPGVLLAAEDNSDTSQLRQIGQLRLARVDAQLGSAVFRVASGAYLVVSVGDSIPEMPVRVRRIYRDRVEIEVSQLDKASIQAPGKASDKTTRKSQALRYWLMSDATPGAGSAPILVSPHAERSEFSRTQSITSKLAEPTVAFPSAPTRKQEQNPSPLPLAGEGKGEGL